MKNPFTERLWISRELRLGIVVAILYVVGAIGLAFGHWGVGVSAIGIGLALVAAFYFAVIRPARIPQDRKSVV